MGPLLFILCTADMLYDLKNKIVLYADDTTLYAEVASPSDHINFAISLNRDLFKIQSCCSMWKIKLNTFKKHSITISQSRTPYPPHPPLTLCRIDSEVSSFLKFLGVTLDDKLTFEKDI